jgi:ribosomal protein S12 methylthiotransferase
VDAFFGVNDLPEIVSMIGGVYRKELTGERILSTPSHYAYLKISEGCDRKCSFCAIPMIRGKHVSRPVEDILTEAKGLVNIGVKELMIISQDSTYYGMDLYRERKLAGLLERLSDIRGLEWIRLHYTYPDSFPMDVLDVISNHKNICNYIDIPLQHINPRILRSMRRGITNGKIRKLLYAIREKVPGIAVRTSIIVGYPGETKQEFDELMSFVREEKFERLGVFTYSHEEDTAAFRLKDDVPALVKKQRAEDIMQIQEEISLNHNMAKIHQRMKVIIDRIEGDFFIGRTEFDSPEVDNEVLVRRTIQSDLTGQIHNVKITKAYTYDLAGEFV